VELYLRDETGARCDSGAGGDTEREEEALSGFRIEDRSAGAPPPFLWDLWVA
jgi:hypothetical protein